MRDLAAPILNATGVFYMIKIALVAAFAAGLSFAASAQDVAPDGSKAVAIEPYVGVLGGYHSFDKQSEFGTSGARGKMDGALVSGVAGVNVPLGGLFVGVEGNATKGFKDIDWEYGVKGRAGFRAGTSGLLYLSGGYQWVNGRGKRGFGDRSDWMWGGGVELGAKDVGLNGFAEKRSPRLRLQVDTYDFDSIRPMAGVIFPF
jgi:outer membrane immunogenic protein